jgi:RNA polymerase sigma-70 factor (ECF subfamily)
MYTSGDPPCPAATNGGVLAMRATVCAVSEADPRTPAPSDDHRLVARVVAGDDRALAELYDRYSALVYGLARRVTGSTAKAEEITQEVFVFLWEHADRFDMARGSLRGFLGAITHRRAVDAVRRDTRRQAREEREHADRASGPTEADPIDLAERAATRDLAERVRAAVALLPRDQREAIELAYFKGCTFRDVAVRLGIPEGTAKSRLRLALNKLANVLSPEVALS